MRTCSRKLKLCIPVFFTVTLTIFILRLSNDLNWFKSKLPTQEAKAEENVSRQNYQTPQFQSPLAKPMPYFRPQSTFSRRASWKQILTYPGAVLPPSYRYSRGRTNVTWVLGVPTVVRQKKSYLLEMLKELIGGMNARYQESCLIVVYVGETIDSRIRSIVKELADNFGDEMRQGLLEVIARPPDYYSDFESDSQTLNENEKYLRWRTKQNLDYMFLMSYAMSRGSYYLQLEDDVRVRDGYLDYIGKFTLLHTNFRLSHHRSWIVLSFCELGFIGKLITMSELKAFLKHVQLFYNHQPIDWLLYSYVQLRVCPWDSFQTPGCKKDFDSYYIRADQSQFQHLGVESSLEKKDQMLKDSKYNQQSGRLRIKHLEQPWNLISSHQYSLRYDRLKWKVGETFIWGYLPQASRLIDFAASHQYDAKEVRIRSQGVEGFDDITVELYDRIPTLERNSSTTNDCGFLMAITYLGGLTRSYRRIFFYMREQVDMYGNWTVLRLFRRFFWSNGSCNKLAPWTLVLLLHSVNWTN
ncbi:alpha-1,3-mannosyl-glycoprotein 4-beta-N-acetylglucosaminyltransferase A [Scaptodrosophila lebanonensis]|uniref:Alpha-1,3-mannosyl-glycoprotein 4-beta-N-acetylglucosaminyltransferase A n=1 Tax=Drosophila lebanonensis TaxID=7225 RepID=A0A6J2T7T5_DROLE|nr:alpha-1,3-mannosyl-glycoprotein 4-beta-N-acetylglucosaminyltransferase A [Scaptodrosophila lebanonensis]